MRTKTIKDKDGVVWIYGPETYDKVMALILVSEVRNEGYKAELVKRKDGYGVKVA